jgi:hypothetical protein
LGPLLSKGVISKSARCPGKRSWLDGPLLLRIWPDGALLLLEDGWLGAEVWFEVQFQPEEVHEEEFCLVLPVCEFSA